jgi:hypothetical protein
MASGGRAPCNRWPMRALLCLSFVFFFLLGETKIKTMLKNKYDF